MLRVSALVALIMGLAVPPAAAQEQASCPWTDAKKPPEQRADELLAAMSLDHKLHMVTFSDPPWMTYWGTAGHISATPELCIPELVLGGSGAGANGLQQGATVFPSGVAQASTWNPKLERRLGEAMGRDAWEKSYNVLLGPGIEIARIATNGRNFEYMGEDPFLAGKMAAAVTRGIQSNPVLAQAKHLVANNQETNRGGPGSTTAVSAEVDERTLREIYLPPFEMSVKEGGLASVMCAYNKLNGTHACENKELLDGYLRRDWHFDGFVTSDWGAVHSTVESALAGLDMEMHVAPPKYFGEPLREAVESGKVPMARLDRMVRNILLPMFRYGLFEHPPVQQPHAYAGQAISPEDRAIARRVAEEGAVLLTNDGGILPLDHRPGRTIGVIGYAAGPVGAPQTSSGGGSAKQGTGLTPPQVSPLEGIQAEAAARGDKVLYADGSSRADATAVAQASDVVIVVAGDSNTEGRDRPDLTMRPGACAYPLCAEVPLDQDAMIEAAAAANENTVVVIAGGGPVAMPWLDNVKAVLHQWYAGHENGNALAALLYGRVSPSGKLPQTFPKSLGDMPTRTPEQYPGVDLRATYSEGLKVGYRWFDSENIEPLFPFGFGLSYTTFDYSDLRVVPAGDGATVSFRIRNTGSRAGAETAQVYVGMPPGIGEPPRQLKGFSKVQLEPREARLVTVELDRRTFSHWSTARHDWAVARGCYSIYVGAHSRDLALAGELPMAGGRCDPKQTVPRKCTSRRSIVVNVRGVRGQRVRRITVYMNGKRTQVQRGASKRIRVRLKGRPGQVVRVRLVAETRSGREIVDRRTYRICPKKAPNAGRRAEAA